MEKIVGNSRKQSPFNSFRLGWIQSAQTVISTSPAGLLESRQPWSNREENKNEMSFRFQRRIRLATGLHLNVSKSGVGFSAGPRGFHVGVDSRRRLDSRRRPYVSAGIPGTGLSWREYPDQQRPEGVKDRGGCGLLILLAVILWIIASVITSLVGIKVEAKQRQKEGGKTAGRRQKKITRNIVERISI